MERTRCFMSAPLPSHEDRRAAVDARAIISQGRAETRAGPVQGNDVSDTSGSWNGWSILLASVVTRWSVWHEHK